MAARGHEEVTALERRFWLEGAGNPDFWDEHMADDGLVLLPMGIMDKPATVAVMDGAAGWQDVEMSALQVCSLGTDAVALAYEAVGHRAGETPFRAVVGSTYARRDGAWRLVLHQQSFAG